MKPSIGVVWRLWLGLGLIVTGILIGLFGLSDGLNLIVMALASLVVLVGLIQFSLWSRLRHCWL